ncbi:ABC transporter permease [Halalkalibacter krulwichiae]|uniref:Nickel transport system permease protein NikC n=1 Tax=Halalkalibacter krulwichiae TaxID=199441 RepID=A0A1X9M9D5_9BACI|nr:ABC transporter permease subunit [Halalkalibacter krulwichiae]ARK30007.1 Nickel transport system permease protein NikC [Halalkalibacter krulwichiae]
MLKIFSKRFGAANLIGAFLLLGTILVGLLAPWLSPHDPLSIHVANRLHPPTWEYPFGTDHLGRCILSRMMYGIRTTVTTAFLIMTFTMMISIPLGLVTAYNRGRSDHFIMRLVDGTLALPDIIITIAIVGILGPGYLHMIMAIVVVRWASYVRFIRSLVIKTTKEDFILTARISGNSHYRIMKNYIFPFISSPILIFAALDMGRIVLLISGLSFLGLGAQPPTPEWGVMLHDATAYFQIAPHVMIFPGLAIMLFVLGCQLISERRKTSDTWI